MSAPAADRSVLSRSHITDRASGAPPRAAGSLLQLYYIRHGETIWSLSSQHTGRTDLALTAHGEDEARALSPFLARVEFSRVLTSPRLRARQTCALAGLDGTAQVDPDLAEWDYGDYEGKRTVEIQRERPGWNVFRDGCPGGETPDQVAVRADRLIASLAPLVGNIALFAHGQFGCALAARWIGMPVLAGQHFAIDPASLGILGHQVSHPGLRVIARWNATISELPHGL
jgi:probable phosphoglycerate mutase